MNQTTNGDSRSHREMEKKKKSIKLNATGNGGYVSKPYSFCDLFETHHEGTVPNQVEEQSELLACRPYSPTMLIPEFSTMSWSTPFDTTRPITSESSESNMSFHTGASAATPTVAHEPSKDNQCSNFDNILCQLF